MTVDEIRELPPQDAIPLLNGFLEKNPCNDEALTARGMCHWALSQRSDAIKDYLAAININPHSKAKEALEAATAILDFRHTDLLNP